MRRPIPILTLCAAALLAQGCVGFDNFVENTISTTPNPNRPLGDSLNMRRVQGLEASTGTVQPEPGNVWPASVERVPTLQDVETTPARRGSEIDRPTRQSSASAAPGMNAAAPAQANPAQAAPAQASSSETAASEAGTGRTGPAMSTTALPDLSQAPRAGQRYSTVSTPRGTEVVAPNGDGSSTLMRPDGTLETVPNRR